MASNLLNVLKKIEEGRQNCIKNAKIANLETYDSMSINAISTLFLQKNTGEYLSDLAEWERPTEWIDTVQILKNAPDIDGQKPIGLLLLDDSYDEFTFIGTNDRGPQYFYANTPAHGLQFSDGYWYTSTASGYDTSINHTWDKTKDIDVNANYKLRYVIVYCQFPTNPNNNQCYCNFSGIPNVLEYVIGDLYTKASETSTTELNLDNVWRYIFKCFNDNYGSGVSITKLKHITAINQDIPLSLKDYWMCGTATLRKISLTNIIKILGQRGLLGCYMLTQKNVNDMFANLESYSGVQAGGSAFINSQYDVRYLKFPKLEKMLFYSGSIISTVGINFYYNLEKIECPILSDFLLINYAYNLKEINAPNVQYVSLGDCYALNSLNLPNCNKISLYKCLALRNCNIPKLTNIQIFEYNSTISNFDFSNVTTIADRDFCRECCLLEYIDLTNLSTISNFGTNAFLNCVSLITIKIAPNFNIDKFDCHNAINLSHECLLEMLNNLIDLTGVTAKTLTLGAKNLAKLTDEEKLIATNKNWILA